MAKQYIYTGKIPMLKDTTALGRYDKRGDFVVQFTQIGPDPAHKVNFSALAEGDLRRKMIGWHYANRDDFMEVKERTYRE